MDRKIDTVPYSGITQNTANDPDQDVRRAAFREMEILCMRFDYLVPWSEIAKGFRYQDKIFKFASKALGIFKPQAMRTALSVRSTIPRKGRAKFYADQTLDFLEHESGLLRYEFQSGGLNKPANRALLGAIELSAPLIYFLGVEESHYHPIFPVWATQLDDQSVGLAVADHEYADVDPSVVIERQTQQTMSLKLADSIPREYKQVQVVQRRHQAWFAKRVKIAYRERCALTGLPIRSLLDAAHIIPDSRQGPASVDNGICMSRLHHAAFDANLIGIDPDYRIHVSNALLDRNDGNLLRNLKELDHGKMCLPRDETAYPKRIYLEQRFSDYLQLNG